MILYKRTDFEGGTTRRTFLIKALEDYCNKKEIIFSRNQEASFFLSLEPKGKPFLKDYPQIHFSISHSSNLWLCGIQEQPLGIDIECNRQKVGLEIGKREEQGRFMKIAGRYFSQPEQNYVRLNGVAGFYRVWVRKEAYIKFKGSGISEVMASFSVVSENYLVQRRGQLYLDEIKLDETAYGAYCSAIPIAIESIVNLDAKGEKL